MKELKGKALDISKGGTESPFSSNLNYEKREGRYHCAKCDSILFQSDNKYDSGSGWPSFDTAVKGSVKYSSDYSLLGHRVEVSCSYCDSHLGHVFQDGPKETTGQRYCINGCILDFKEK